MARKASGLLSGLGRAFDEAATTLAQASGRPAGFALALAVVVVWAATGPFFRYSDSWMLVMSTAATIVTFLMVFIIQASQNRDSAAIQVKLDELIRSSGAKNAFMGIENLSKAEIQRLRKKRQLESSKGRAN